MFTDSPLSMLDTEAAHNVTRAAGVLAPATHARARPATIRAQLINIPARIANGARRLRLPQNWPWQDAWAGMFAGAYAHP